MSDPEEESSPHQNNKFLIEAITVRMEQVMDSSFKTLRQKLQPGGSKPEGTWQKRDHGRIPRRSQERQHSSRDEAAVNYEDQRVRSSHSSQRRSRASRDEAEPLCGHHKQNNLQQTSQLQKQMDRQKILDDLDQQILKALEAVENSQKKKSTASQPSSESVATNQEPSCFKEKPVVQRTEKDQPLLICKGMNESSNSTMCANEIFMCHGKEKDANAKPMVLEESAKSNTKEEEETSESMQIGDECETPPVKRELVGNETPCEVQEETLPKEVQRSLPLSIELEQPTSHEPKTIPKSLSYDCPKQCKETISFNAKHSLFVLVSIEEEKRFGLEKVKEFCVSENVFDKMIPTFENFEFEKIFEPKRFMCSELDSSLRNPSDFKMSDLFRTKTEFAYIRTVSKQMLESVLCVTNPISASCESSLNDHGFDNYYLKLAPINLFANNKRSLFALCSKETLCVNQYYNAILVYDLVYSFISDHTDITHLSLSKESNTGLRVFLKNTKKKRRKRRSQRREDDKRFKPPDLDQDIHQDISLSMRVKEAPPDTIEPQPSPNKVGGMFLNLYNSESANLSYLYADSSDLRTNPFQEGEDDMILDSTKEMEFKPEGSKLKAMEHGAVKDASREPVGSMTRSRTKKIKECIGGMLKPTAQPGAKLSTLVLIQAH